jgi:hypothetical protein
LSTVALAAAVLACDPADGPPPRDEGLANDGLSASALYDGGAPSQRMSLVSPTSTRTTTTTTSTTTTTGDDSHVSNAAIAMSAAGNDDPNAATSNSPAAAAPGVPKTIGARHVLIQWIGAQSAGPAVVRTRAQALTVAEEVLRRAKAGEDLGRLAVEFSDEPNASARGGSLGRFGHGQMVKEFEEAAFKLKVGELSPIVETAFGFHVIQRTE